MLREKNIANLNVTRVSVLFLDVGCKRRFDPSWITTYATMGGMAILIIILCVSAQHISRQCSINKVTLQMLLALENPDCRPP